jgi:hypothetical protein
MGPARPWSTRWSYSMRLDANPPIGGRLGTLLAAASVIILLGGCVGSDEGVTAEQHAGAAPTPEQERFDPEIVKDLPDPSRRFLLRAIAPGTLLADAVELEMHGTLRLAPDRDPAPFVAEQFLAPPERFVWRARTTGGLLRIRGFDRYEEGEGEMRWRLFGLIPVVRVDGARARYRMTVGDETVETTLEVDGEGRPVRAEALRWSERAGPGYEPFVVELAGALSGGGYTIPSRIEAGWSLGREDEFRFFKARLDRLRFR